MVTGDGSRVRSHYRRILAENPAMKGHARNVSQAGVSVSALPAQATRAGRQRADYVTILIGANDACRGEMTPVAEFRDRLDSALARLKKGLPRARVLVVSLPNVYRVWEIGHTHRPALTVWRAGICPNLLRNPTSTAEEDVNRRRWSRITTQRDPGGLPRYGSHCRTQHRASAFDLNSQRLDYFHPSHREGLAEETYPGRFTWG